MRKTSKSIFPRRLFAFRCVCCSSGAFHKWIFFFSIHVHFKNFSSFFFINELFSSHEYLSVVEVLGFFFCCRQRKHPQRCRCQLKSYKIFTVTYFIKDKKWNNPFDDKGTAVLSQWDVGEHSARNGRKKHIHWEVGLLWLEERNEFGLHNWEKQKLSAAPCRLFFVIYWSDWANFLLRMFRNLPELPSHEDDSCRIRSSPEDLQSFGWQLLNFARTSGESDGADRRTFFEGVAECK